MSQMNRRRALQLLAALGTTGLTAACASDGDEGPATPTGDPIKIGLIAPQTGGFKSIGDEIVNGFQLYLTLHGQQFSGHPVTVLTADEGETANTGKAAVDSLLKQGALALTGVVNSAVMVGIRDNVEKARVPLIGSNASPKSLQSVVYIWRTSYVLDEPGRAIGPYMAQRLPIGSRVAIIAPDNLGSRDVIQGLQAQFSTAGSNDPRIADPVIWTDTTSTPGSTAYVADIRTALARQPDAIFCHFAGTAAVQFIKQLHREGWTGPIYAPGFLTEGTVLDELREVEARNIVTALNYSADLNNTANRTFASAYRKTHGASPTTYAMASYDAAQVLDKAIRLAGTNPNSQQINLALGKIGQIDSPRGAWQFNQPRTPQQKWYLRKVQRDGRVLSNVLSNELATLG
ncbi:extracellular ligand-binding receptor [Micromonospora sp. ATCC 39149]|uniref:ABC transporter substrate-binding protein n=1 Tax=Micromonospora carbonacea TaxID=47853 RepID=A0A7D5YD95_9ACTN|nr:ABC transporter substrate-binding protein [Micromonospora sp. ATCC 39149]EEP72477.1 extracellular ligand-binding receptor [Micromonospora sp. ATCC 39149]QLJ98613.1 ABC transporter substrate-binding protein [Micromonospora carbonacea]